MVHRKTELSAHPLGLTAGQPRACIQSLERLTPRPFPYQHVPSSGLERKKFASSLKPKQTALSHCSKVTQSQGQGLKQPLGIREWGKLSHLVGWRWPSFCQQLCSRKRKGSAEGAWAVFKVPWMGSSGSSLQSQEQRCSDGLITGIDQAAGRSSGVSQALEGTETNE